MKIHFFINFPKPNGVSDAFPKGRRNKSLVIFGTEPWLIGWFLYSIFIEILNFSQTKQVVDG